MRIEFIIPGKPMAQPRMRMVVVNGKQWQYEPKTSKAKKKEIAMVALGYMRRNSIERLCEPFKMEVICGLPIPASWSKKKKNEAREGLIKPCGKLTNDWDNLGKLVSDALNGICYEDDGLCVDGRVQKLYSEEPHTKVVIERINENI